MLHRCWTNVPSLSLRNFPVGVPVLLFLELEGLSVASLERLEEELRDESPDVVELTLLLSEE